MKSTTTFDLVLVPFPFSDLSSTKKRPCLVIKRYEVRKLGAFLIASMITSQLEGFSFPGDLRIRDWKEAGLPKPSLIRLGKVVSIEESIVLKKLGKLSTFDQKAIRENWNEFFTDFS